MERQDIIRPEDELPFSQYVQGYHTNRFKV